MHVGTSQRETIIAVRGAALRLGGKDILTGIDLEVGRGEFLCLVGPSGCGKTSLLRLMAGLVQPGAGQVLYQDHPVFRPQRDVAIVFQDYGKALLPWRTAAGNVSLALEAAGVAKQKRGPQVEKLLAKVGLNRHADRYPGEMSGGMQQRLQIARCLAQEPSVLLMDEPFGALDALTRQSLQDEVLSIAATTATTVVFVTHDLEEAIYLGDRVIGLHPNPGRIGREFAVPLSRPRNQLTTRESEEFLHLRRHLFEFIERAEKESSWG